MICEEESIEYIYYIWNYFDESHLFIRYAKGR